MVLLLLPLIDNSTWAKSAQLSRTYRVFVCMAPDSDKQATWSFLCCLKLVGLVLVRFASKEEHRQVRLVG